MSTHNLIEIECLFTENLLTLEYSKYDIIENAKNGNPYEPKSTKHLIYCEEELDWFPITLISTLFNLKLN